MTITAKFSNGHTDTYKGKRPVKAAWMVVLPSGNIKSGHSLDRIKASKTAATYTTALYASIHGGATRGSMTVGMVQFWGGVAKKEGFKTIQDYFAHVKAQNAALAAKCKIEIVDL